MIRLQKPHGDGRSAMCFSFFVLEGKTAAAAQFFFSRLCRNRYAYVRYGGNSRCVAGEIRSAEEGEFDSNADCFSTLRHCTTYVHCMCKCHVHFHSTKQPRAQVFQIFPTKLISPPEKNFLLCKLIGCLASALLNATKLHYRNVQRENQGGEDSQENKKIWKADIKSIS